MSAAREALIRDAGELASMRGWNVEVVFDSYLTSEPASRYDTSPALTVVYTGKTESCDSYMERMSFELDKNGTAFVAATVTWGPWTLTLPSPSPTRHTP